MKTIFILVVCLLWMPAIGEQKNRGNAVQVLDDSIFEAKKSESSSDTVENAEGKKRYRGRDADYTSDKAAEWTQKCSVDNEKGTQGYRDCYKKYETVNKGAITEGREAVQRKMGSTGSAKNLLPGESSE